MIKAYEEQLKSVTLRGPTNYSHIIDRVIEQALLSVSREDKTYHHLVIMTVRMECTYATFQHVSIYKHAPSHTCTQHTHNTIAMHSNTYSYCSTILSTSTGVPAYIWSHIQLATNVVKS